MKNNKIKFFSIVLVICLLILGFYYLYKKDSDQEFFVEDAKQEDVATTSNKVIEQKNNIVDSSNKLQINDDSEIEGYLQGYYFPYTKTGEYVDVPFSEKCEGFVVKTGDENGLKLKQYFTNMVIRGNTVNRLSDEGYLIINLNPNDIQKLDVLEQETLKNSNEVIISVKKLKQRPTEAKPCHSFVELYQVDEYQYD